MQISEKSQTIWYDFSGVKYCELCREKYSFNKNSYNDIPVYWQPTGKLIFRDVTGSFFILLYFLAGIASQLLKYQTIITVLNCLMEFYGLI